MASLPTSVITRAGDLRSDGFLANAYAQSNTPRINGAVNVMAAGPATGVVLARGLDIGCVPATPLAEHDVSKPDRVSETTLLGAAMRLGEPVGFAQEHGGDIVQNLFPLASSIGRQLSTSSGVELAFHTETAFHPHRPRYLLLLCLRGDPAAATTLCAVDDIVTQLSAETRQVLSQPRFRCGVDESFGPGTAWITEPSEVLNCDDGGRETMTFDGELTTGIDARAEQAIAEVNTAIARARTSMTLESGDLLLIDNQRTVHGRSPFTARFDGTDRWLQRTFVVTDLAPSTNERHGRVITTRFD